MSDTSFSRNGSSVSVDSLIKKCFVLVSRLHLQVNHVLFFFLAVITINRVTFVLISFSHHVN